MGGRNSIHAELKSPLQQRRENDDPSNGYEDHEDGSEEDRHRLFDQEMSPRLRRLFVDQEMSPRLRYPSALLFAQQSEVVLALSMALPLLAMGVMKEGTQGKEEA